MFGTFDPGRRRNEHVSRQWARKSLPDQVPVFEDTQLTFKVISRLMHEPGVQVKHARAGSAVMAPMCE